MHLLCGFQFKSKVTGFCFMSDDGKKALIVRKMSKHKRITPVLKELHWPTIKIHGCCTYI